MQRPLFVYKLNVKAFSERKGYRNVNTNAKGYTKILIHLIRKGRFGVGVNRNLTREKTNLPYSFIRTQANRVFRGYRLTRNVHKVPSEVGLPKACNRGAKMFAVK